MNVSAALRSEWEQRGYVVVRGLLGTAEVAALAQAVEHLLAQARARRPGGRTWVARMLARTLKPTGVASAWTLPDGVTKTPALWPLVVHPGLLEWVRGLLGPGARYLQHSDVHAGFSAVAWHRDSVARRYARGRDWQEQPEPYRLMRAGFYLQRSTEDPFRLGLVPGTQRVQSGLAHLRNQRLERATRPWAQVLSWWRQAGALHAEADWVRTEPGDAILFDPRILHSGTATDGPKRSLFVAYGLPGSHFERHARYYRHGRPELHYGDPSPEFLALLRAHGVEPPRLPVTPGGEAGHVPPRWQTLLARRLRG